MSRLAQAGDSRTASPGRACSKHQRTACGSVSWRRIGTSVDASAAATASASRPISATARTCAATAWCFEQAQPGDAVLLSPACASLDMFRNYAHRAEVFVETVRALATERGEVIA